MSPSPDIREGPLAAAAIRTLTAAPREVWVALGLLYVFNVGLHWMGLRADVPLTGAQALQFSLPMMTFHIVQALAVASARGLMLHGLLCGDGVRRPDRGFAAFVLFTALVSVVADALRLIMVTADPKDPANAGLILGVTAMVLVGGVAVVRLLLLPMSWLTGEPMTPRAAWSRMSGQFWPYVWASIVLTLPPVLLAVGVLGLRGDPAAVASRDPAWAILDQALLIPFVALSVGLDAAIFRRRTGAQTRPVYD